MNLAMAAVARSPCIQVPHLEVRNPAPEEQRIASQFIGRLKRCSEIRDLKRLHQEAIAARIHTDKYLATTLISMYRKCGSMALAQQVFDAMDARVRCNPVTWAALLLGYVQNGKHAAAINLFEGMDCRPHPQTYVAALKACGGLASKQGSDKRACLQKGIAIHSKVKQLGFEKDVGVAIALIGMYSKCGRMQQAREIFDRMDSKDVYAWTALIGAYAENGESSVAMDLFSSMDCRPNSFTYVAALNACGALAAARESEKQFCLEKGESIHKQIEEQELQSNIVVATALIDMYSRCGSMKQARDVFDRMVRRDSIAWTSLLLGYVENGESSVALDLFAEMDCEPRLFTYVVALKACSALVQSDKQARLEKGMAIHKQVKQRGFESDIAVATTLVDMYSKCGSMDLARGVFDRMALKNCAAWTSLMLGYVETGENSVAMELFSRMECEPDSITYVAALKACGNLAALRDVQQIHARICRAGLEQVQLVATTLMSAYGKCSDMSGAESLFVNMNSPQLVSWTALIGGYSLCGDPCRVFNLVKQMREAGVQLNRVTFVCVLSACGHAGLVEEGKLYFKSMPNCGVFPDVEHYSCMVDLLGRANRLQEALELVKSMPFEPSAGTWTMLLGSCRSWNNLEVGKVAFNALLGFRDQEATPYLLMSEIYKNLSMWKDWEEMNEAAARAREISENGGSKH